MPGGGNTGGGSGTTYTAGNGISISGSSISVSNPPNFLADGRLTLTTAVPVTSADVTGAGTLYYTPYVGDRISLYDGTNWVPNTFTELSLALTLTSGKNYDVFVWNNSGTLTLATGTAWTNDSTRANALVRQNGVWVNNVAEGSMAQYRGRYVGTIRASGSNTTEDSGFPAVDTVPKRYVWNMYNRVRRPLVCRDSTNSWAYTTAAYRQARAATTNQIEFVIGLTEVPVKAHCRALADNSAGGNPNVAVGIGVDSTTVDSANLKGNEINVQNMHMPIEAYYQGYPALGFHYLAWLEYSDASGTTTWYGDSGVTIMQSGLEAEIWA